MAVDATGVGRPVIDMIRDANLPATVYPITLTGGDAVIRDGMERRVPKRDVASTIAVLLQTGRLRIARGLKESDTPAPRAPELPREDLPLRPRQLRGLEGTGARRPRPGRRACGVALREGHRTIPSCLLEEEIARMKKEESRMSFVIGVELGQVSDVTAIAVVESLTLPFLRTEEIRREGWIDVRPVYQAPDGTETREHPPVNFALRHLERFPVGSSYVEIRDRVEARARSLRGPAVVLDASGVGTAAVNLFRTSSLYITTVTLVAGDQSAHDGSDYRVPKKDIVSVTQVLLQTGRLKIAKALPHAKLLARELMNFRSRVTTQTIESQLDWREGANDDLVLALAIAAWQAEQNPGLGFSFSCGVSEMDGWGNAPRAWGEPEEWE